MTMVEETTRSIAGNPTLARSKRRAAKVDVAHVVYRSHVNGYSSIKYCLLYVCLVRATPGRSTRQRENAHPIHSLVGRGGSAGFVATGAIAEIAGAIQIGFLNAKFE
jgi:hypothetical protein